MDDKLVVTLFELSSLALGNRRLFFKLGKTSVGNEITKELTRKRDFSNLNTIKDVMGLLLCVNMEIPSINELLDMRNLYTMQLESDNLIEKQKASLELKMIELFLNWHKDFRSAINLIKEM